MLPYGRMECASYITSHALCILYSIRPLFSNMAMLILKVRKKQDEIYIWEELFVQP